MDDAEQQPRTEPETGNDHHGRGPGVPRWVKVSAVVVAIMVLVLVAIMIIGGGEHGPSRHAVDKYRGQVNHTAAVGEATTGHRRVGA